MIIFNFNAIIVGIVIAVVVGPIYWLMPDQFANSPVGILILSSIGTLIAGICEGADLKGRLFFVPMWILGIIGTLGYTYMEYSWKGLGVLALVLLGIFGLILLLAYFMERNEWNDAFRSFQELKKMKQPEGKDYWEQVVKAKFFPSMMSCTHAMCAHNFEVLSYLKQTGLDWEEIDKLIPVFQHASVKGNDIDIDAELTDAFEYNLNDMIESFEEETA